MSEELEKRLTELEARTAFQDRLIEELSASIMEVHKDLAQSQQQLLAMAQRLDAQAGDGAQTIVDPKPPHY